MKVKTILFIQDCSNQEYAQWVYNYRLSGFFSKINFEKWNKKLKDLGIAYEFWEEYKKLKGEENQEEKQNSYDYLEKFIEQLINKIKYGYSKEEIIVLLEDIRNKYPDLINDISDSEFEYCYNEALTKINREKSI
jgi:cupin superfamily acireductone dioxygenase involved in methionine salvage